MKCKIMLICFMAMLIAQPLFAQTGREIMEKSDALPEPQTAMSRLLMLVYKGERMEEKEFTLQMKQYPNDEDKTLIAFIRPTQIKLLTHARKGGDDDQWLRLSSGRIKRIAASDKGQPFVNSHFYYQDLSSTDIDDYEYELLGEEEAVGEACYKVQGVKTAGEKVYDKLNLYVRKSDYFVVRIDFYKDGEFHKFLENYQVKEIDGILTPYKVKMERADGKGKTELVLRGVKYNADISDMTFRREALR
ncbi:MAG: outer membrane lipoprotein-sorting protein [Thermodesulfobacteriota bacterium]